MNPQNVVRTDELQQRRAEGFIDLLVLQPVVLIVLRGRGKIVEQRPDRLVAKTFVELVEVLLG